MRGIERRKPRIIVPRRWAVLSVLRGIVNPLVDARHGARRGDAALVAKLDSREGEEQPTTAAAR